MRAAVLSLPPYHSFFFTFPLHGSNGHPPPIEDYPIGLTQQTRQIFHRGTYCELFFQSPRQGRRRARAKIDFFCRDLLPVEDCRIGLTQQTRQKHHCGTCCDLFFLSPLQGRRRARAKFEFRFTQCLQIADIAFRRYLLPVEEYLIGLTQQTRQEFHCGTYCVLFSLSPPQGRRRVELRSNSGSRRVCISQTSPSAEIGWTSSLPPRRLPPSVALCDRSNNYSSGMYIHSM